MSRDVVLAMARALPGVKEDGNSIHLDETADVTMHTGRAGSVFSIQQVTKITFENAFLVAETHKGARVVMLLDEVRGFTAEPASGGPSRGGRKTGFA